MRLATWYYYNYQLLVSQLAAAAGVSAGQQKNSNYETRNQSRLEKNCLAPHIAGAVAVGEEV